MTESRLHSSIDRLVATHDFVAKKPASIDQIVAREKDLETKFPEELKAFYFYANGLSTQGGFFRFISLPSLSLDWFNSTPYLKDLGLLPILDANESCDVKSFPPSSNDAFDETLFEKLITGLDPDDQEGNSFRLCFAMDLCPDSESARIANLIALGDEYIRDAALDRLKAIDNDDARRALAEDQREYLSFVNKISKMADKNRVEGLNMRVLFAARNTSDFQDRLNHLLGLD